MPSEKKQEKEIKKSEDAIAKLIAIGREKG